MKIYCVESNLFIIEITGGSVRIIDKAERRLIKEFKGYNYLYTGEINPNEHDFFALENGKHFYIYSLESFELLKTVTLPRTYESIDVCGFYSEYGRVLNIPAQRYVYNDKNAERGHYEYVIFKYETDNYTLIEKVDVVDQKPYRWKSKNWQDKR